MKLRKPSRNAAVILAATLATLGPINTRAGEAELAVSDAYVRMAPPGTPTTGAFMTIRNESGVDRKLVRADSQVAKTVELHNHINDNGVMKMRQVREIDVKAKGEATLKPGSYHIMLIDLKQPLKDGETVALTLSFDDGSTKKVDAPVRRPQAMMQMMDQGHMKH